MKTILSLFIILSYLSIAQATAQEKTSTGTISYEIDFVFTGQVDNHVDSLFALQYTFTKADFVKFSKLHLENASKKYSINTGETSSDSLDIVTDNQKVYLRLKRYNKYDLPVLMQAEDKTGNQSALYLRHKSGKLTSGADFKNEVKASRNRVLQHHTNKN